MAIAGPPRVDLARFEEEGYLVVEDVLDVKRDIEPVINEYMELIDRLTADWHAAGVISSTFADLPLSQRLVHLVGEMGSDAFKPLDITLPFTGITEQTPIHTGPAVFNLITSPRLIDVVEQFIGSEILSNPIQHVRIKPPQALLPAGFHNTLLTQSDWHQDQGVALPEIDETDMLTVWLPITDATEENGCLCVVPGSHKGGLATHCPGLVEGRKALHIPDSVRGEYYKPLPFKQGGVLFMHRQTMHASLKNVSMGARWSFDLRYQPVGQPTGRPWFPAFVVRSRLNPQSEVRDPQDWTNMWHTSRRYLTANPPQGKFNRWSGDEAVCEVA